MADLNVTCACGSGKPAGACCEAGEPCQCGSGKPAGQCCFAAQVEKRAEA